MGAPSRSEKRPPAADQHGLGRAGVPALGAPAVVHVEIGLPEHEARHLHAHRAAGDDAADAEARDQRIEQRRAVRARDDEGRRARVAHRAHRRAGGARRAASSAKAAAPTRPAMASPLTGITTTPSAARPATARPIITANSPLRSANSRVPSSGSTNHTRGEATRRATSAGARGHALLGEDGVARERGGERRADELVGLAVGARHRIARALELDGEGRGVDGAHVALGGAGDAEHLVELVVGCHALDRYARVEGTRSFIPGT